MATTHKERCSTLLLIMEMQNKTADAMLCSHQNGQNVKTQLIPSVCEDLDQIELSYIADKNGKWHKSFEKQCGIIKKLNIAYSGISLQDNVPSENAYICSAKYTYRKVHGRTLCKHQKLETTPMSTTVVYSHNGMLYHNGNEQNYSLYMNLTTIMLNERIQKPKNVYNMVSLTSKTGKTKLYSYGCIYK